MDVGKEQYISVRDKASYRLTHRDFHTHIHKGNTKWVQWIFNWVA